jgi:hypothetical protein
MKTEQLLEADSARESESHGSVTFEAEDVTGSQCIRATFQADLPVGQVTLALASDMSLPTDVPWALRKNRTADFLDETQPIGRQITPDERVTITPKSHLG